MCFVPEDNRKMRFFLLSHKSRPTEWKKNAWWPIECTAKYDIFMITCHWSNSPSFLCIHPCLTTSCTLCNYSNNKKKITNNFSYFFCVSFFIHKFTFDNFLSKINKSRFGAVQTATNRLLWNIKIAFHPIYLFCLIDRRFKNDKRMRNEFFVPHRDREKQQNNAKIKKFDKWKWINKESALLKTNFS